MYHIYLKFSGLNTLPYFNEIFDQYVTSLQVWTESIQGLRRYNLLEKLNLMQNLN